MEKIVDELHKIMKFKDSTEVGDIILIVIEEPQTLMYGRVTAIERDTQKKDEWWHLSFDILAVPPQPSRWTLRMAQFTGAEIFTMGGEKRFVKAVDFDSENTTGDEPEGGVGGRPKLRVLK